MKVVWSPEAEAQVNAALTYIGRRTAAPAERWLAQLLAAIENLKEFPESGRPHPDFDHDALREIIVDRYRVAYFVHHKSIEIVSVWHGARKAPGRGIAGALDDE